jgi:LuxR family maltose regulon positive regulatory protein
VARAPRDAGWRLTMGFADLLVGLSHVFEGNADRAVAFLQPKLLSAERELGRRSTLAAMLAGPLARAHMLRGDADAALATLAGRIDVIERGGLPDPAVLAYRTLAAIATGRGDDARAVEVLAAMYEFGARRELPRVMFVSLADQIRLHAAQGRVDTATGLLAQLGAFGAVLEQPAYLPFRWYYERMRSLATTYALFAASDLEGAAGALVAWIDAGLMAQRGALALTARAMLALIDHARGRPEARERLAEVLSLADLGGIRGYVESAHPQLAVLIASLGDTCRAPAPRSSAMAVRARVAAEAGAAPTVSSGLLTSKEAQVLSLLAIGKANKEIARAMDIGEQTVKWHLKNVFFKLNAASRKHAVDRARLLGLLGG